MTKKISALDVKQALLDPRFQETLPESLLPDLKKFMSNPGCACNHPIYRKIMKDAGEQLAAYYPTKEAAEPGDDEDRLPKNNWTVINCSIHELQSRLSKLPPGRKQLDVSRWEDQVTVVVNELDGVF